MTKRQLIALLALFGLLIATYLTLYSVGAISQLTCAVGSCETVQTSRWANFLGIPVAAWGVVFYVVLLGL
ncbi:MAG: vitamin K epoxide reductase family protein, partial [Vicinamibacterales bacterium]